MKPAKSTSRRTPACTSKLTPPAKGKVVLLSGGNPQIPKGDGDAVVQAYIAAMPEWKSTIGKQLDRLIEQTVPQVRKVIRWNSPFYGVEGQGYFISYHVFAKYVKVCFIKGKSLKPLPPIDSKDPHARYLHIHENDALDVKQLAAWIKQAAAIPGWDPSTKAN